MIIVFAIKKVGDISFVSHIDFMRILQRALGRAGLEVQRSNGFNKHPITYCSHPLPVGVQSNSEFFVYQEASRAIQKETYTYSPNPDYLLADIHRAFQEALPQGVIIKASYCMQSNPNVAGKVAWCDYSVPFRGGEKAFLSIKERLSAAEIIMTFDSKGVEKSIDIQPLLGDITLNDGIITMRLATGNPTLRPDKLIDFLNLELENDAKLSVSDTFRESHILLDNDTRINAEDYLEMNYSEKYPN